MTDEFAKFKPEPKTNIVDTSGNDLLSLRAVNSQTFKELSPTVYKYYGRVKLNIGASMNKILCNPNAAEDDEGRFWDTEPDPNMITEVEIDIAKPGGFDKLEDRMKFKALLIKYAPRAETLILKYIFPSFFKEGPKLLSHFASLKNLVFSPMHPWLIRRGRRENPEDQLEKIKSTLSALPNPTLLESITFSCHRFYEGLCVLKISVGEIYRLVPTLKHLYFSPSAILPGNVKHWIQRDPRIKLDPSNEIVLLKFERWAWDGEIFEKLLADIAPVAIKVKIVLKKPSIGKTFGKKTCEEYLRRYNWPQLVSWTIVDDNTEFLLRYN